MKVSLVLKEHADLVWPVITEFLKGAAKYTYGRYDAQDIIDVYRKSDQQLWIAFDSEGVHAFVVTEIMQYPRLTALVMHFTGGRKLKECKPPIIALIQRFAKDHGCDVIESQGRRGWENVFKNDGFKARFVCYELPVESVQ